MKPVVMLFTLTLVIRKSDVRRMGSSAFRCSVSHVSPLVARSDVACADCHMPYKREGALKISDHYVRSPLLNINRACQPCHKWPESELKQRAEAIQEHTQDMRNLAMDALVELIGDLKSARAGSATEQQISAAQDFQRKAQFYLDFVEAENSSGFHAPQEALRILGESINFSRKGQVTLRPLTESPRDTAHP
jgi:nitrite reductase (cytochrome c-552)